jgi:hypothetical protein
MTLGIGFVGDIKLVEIGLVEVEDDRQRHRTVETDSRDLGSFDQ